MKRIAFISVFVAAAIGCGSSGEQVVDGAPVSADGWPVRPAGESFRCPEGTSVVDEIVANGRRRVTCKTALNPAPRGFELAWHANGQLALVRRLDSSGRPTTVTQYGPDGHKLVVEEWEDGQRRTVQAWYPTGQVRQVETFDEARGATKVESFAPDGSIEAQGTLVDGVREGMWIEWVDGATERATYERGARVGDVTRTYADGSVEKGSYRAGERHGLWRRLDQNGLPMKEARYQNGVLDGVWRAWHPNQQMKASGRYLSGQQHGPWQTWYPSGQESETAFYVCGTRHGLFVEYHPNGEIAQRGVYWNGKPIGEWRYWSNDGDLTNVESFSIPDPAIDVEKLKSGQVVPDLPSACVSPKRIDGG